MKKTVLSFCLLLLPLMLMAAPVTQEQAMQKAREFMTGHPKMAKGGMLKAAPAPLKMQSAQATASYYIFNVGEQQGFVVVSGDDRTPAILGYADNGSFDANDIPANMQAWLEDYERQISMLDDAPSGDPSPFTLHPSPVTNIPNHAPIAPLIQSLWYQDSPYNDLCPIDPYTNEVSLSGCAATAMAQIMNYYKYPDATKAVIPAYKTDTYGIQMKAIPKNTAIDWDNMLDVYDENATEVQRQAVAKLMQLCGQAVKMNYTSQSSSAYSNDAALAFFKYFGYDKNLLFKSRYNYIAAEWDELVYHELEEQRPVYMGAHSIYSGHAFIIDGYDHDGLFHINWGWGGRYDGNFLLSVLDRYTEGTEATVTEYGYSCSQNIITGLQKPVETETPDANPAMTSSYIIVNTSENEFSRLSNGIFSIPVYFEMFNETIATRSYDVGCGVYNAQGERVSESFMYTMQNMSPLSAMWCSSNVILPADLPDGVYTLRCLSKLVGTDEWLLGNGNFNMYIECTIKDNLLTTRGLNDYSLSGTIVSTIEQPTVGVKVPLEATVTNNGTNFNDLLYFIVNNSYMGGQRFDVASGETESVNLAYTPTRSGANDVRLVVPVGERDFVAAQGTINVLGSEAPELLFDFDIKDLRRNSSVPHTNIDVTLYLHNNSRNAYNDKLILKLFKRKNNDEWEEAKAKEIQMMLKGDSDSLLQVSFEGLDNGADYYLAGFYRDAEGAYLMHDNETVFFSPFEPVDGKEDMTYMIENPDFQSGTYAWNIDAVSEGHVRAGGAGNNICFEAWNNSQFDINQTITGLPAGIYQIQVQGFYRNRRDNAAWNAWQNSTINVPVYVYLNNSATPLKNVFDEPANGGFYSGDYYTSPTGLYFPNDMATAATAFSADMYRQSAYGLIMSENDIVKIGVKGATNQNNDSWAIWDNFKLTYLGFDVQYVRPALQQAIATAENLMAQMMGKAAFEQLSSVLAEAKAAEQTTDGEQMFQVLSRLYTVSDEAVASATNFQGLAYALDNLQWAINHYQVASAAVQQQAADMLAEISAKALNHQYEDTAVEGLVAQINAIAYQLRIPDGLELATATNPVECTSLLNCPSFERDGENVLDSWWGQGYYGLGNNEFQRTALALEVFQNNLRLYQPVYNIPNGYYAMQVSSFYRYGTPDQDAEYYRQGNTSSPNAILLMGDPETGGNEVTKPIKLMSSEYSKERLSNADEYYTKDGYYVPNDMVSAVTYFKAGHYQNAMLYNVTNNSLYLGFNKNGIVENDWLMIDDFRLFYYGTEKPSDQIVGINNSPFTLHPSPFTVYDLQGRRVSGSQKGLVISREQQSDGSVVVRKIVK